MAATPSPLVWDYDLSEDAFNELLAGGLTVGRLDRDWAAVRLLEYGAYEDIRRRLPLKTLVLDWPRWRLRVRSETRRRGLDFLVGWVTRERPDLL
jgi:hypothetical protein